MGSLKAQQGPSREQLNCLLELQSGMRLVWVRAFGRCRLWPREGGGRLCSGETTLTDMELAGMCANDWVAEVKGDGPNREYTLTEAGLAQINGKPH